MSVSANFNDPRCVGKMVCPNDPLLYTCTVNGSEVVFATVTLPSGEVVKIESGNTTSGEGSLPNGVIVKSHNAEVEGGKINYTIILSFEKASLLSGSVTCDANTVSIAPEVRNCSVAGMFLTIEPLAIAFLGWMHNVHPAPNFVPLLLMMDLLPGP